MQRLADGEDLPGFALRRDVTGENLSVVAQRFHAGEAENIQGASHFVAGLRQTQTRLAGNEAGEFFPAGCERGARPVQHGRALVAGGRARHRQACLNGGIRLGAPAQRHRSNFTLIVRVAHGQGLAVSAAGPGATDETGRVHNSQ